MRAAPATAILLALLRGPAAGGEPGGSALDFLRLGGGARQAAMGETGLAACDDLGSSFYNPAALAGLGRQEVNLSHTQWLEGISYQQTAYAHPTLNRGTIAGAVHYLSWGDIAGYDAQGGRTGNIKVNDLALQAGWGRELRPGFYSGASLKYIQETLDTVTGRTAAADLGFNYRPSFGGWASRFKYGAAVRNLGPGIKFIDKRENLPWDAGGGMAYRSRDESLTIAAEFSKPADNSLHGGVGGEFWVMDLLALRMGYKMGGDLSNGFNAGFGIRYGKAQIDYALAHFGALGYTHRVGMSLRFGGVAEAWYERGMSSMRRGDYEQALLHFDKVLMLKPDHPRALKKLKESHERLVEKEKEE
ncbi:MAG: hypothetical protein A3J74_09520 [Elusimicrobia bacterium RIFCSPHIGHO2_02_FULL_57_9]|nr:MAG: hypothetical protein A3J74_09520 [Elusimicrobia bacterium RIFCSPHIGHO2_02_FULL_57_9]